jgi:hypothetical protein
VLVTGGPEISGPPFFCFRLKIGEYLPYVWCGLERIKLVVVAIRVNYYHVRFVALNLAGAVNTRPVSLCPEFS